MPATLETISTVTYHNGKESLTFDELIPEQAVTSRICELGRQLAPFLIERPEDTIVMPILTGATRFADALLVSAAEAEPGIEPSVEAVRLSSYSGQTKASGLRVVQGLSTPVKGKRVVVVDEVIDSGETVNHLIEKILKPEKPEAIIVAALVAKPGAHSVEVQKDLIGFDVPADAFLVGWGMDWAGKGRWLNWVGALRRVSGYRPHYTIPEMQKL